MSDLNDINFGEVDLPSSAPLDTAREEVDVSGEFPTPNEPLSSTPEATAFFESVPESEALNHIMMLHDIRAISFDRLNQLKEILDNTTSFLPKGY